MYSRFALGNKGRTKKIFVGRSKIKTHSFYWNGIEILEEYCGEPKWRKISISKAKQRKD